MNNSLGTDSHDLVVLEPGRPDGPGVIELVATTDHSVTLQWRPGFDGGYNQSFVVSESCSWLDFFLRVNSLPISGDAGS